MPRLEFSKPRISGFRTSLRATLLAPGGPPRLRQVRGAGARVIAAPGRYSMSYLIEGPTRCVLVDVGSGQDVPRLARIVQQIDKPVGLIVATHLHFDHVLGVERAAERLDAPVALSPPGYESVSAGRALRPPIRWGMRWFWLTWVWQGLPPFHRLDMPRGLGLGFPWSRNRLRAPLAEPLEDGAPLPHVDGWRVLLTPGHSDDSLCLLHEEAGLLIAGDTVRNYQGGEWNPLLTDRAQYAESVARLRALEVRAVLPGHGPMVTGRGCLDALRPLPW